MFADPLPDASQFEAPSVSAGEVFRMERRRRGEDDALRAAALMCCHRGILLSSAIAPEAARLAHEGGPATANGVSLATAPLRGATLRTRDAEFEGMTRARCFQAKPA